VPTEPVAAVAAPEPDVTFLTGDQVSLAIGASRAVWVRSPTAVVTLNAPTSVAEAADLATALAMPLLLGEPEQGEAPSSASSPTGTPDAAVAGDDEPTPTEQLADELDRLGVQTAVVVGDPPVLPPSVAVVTPEEVPEDGPRPRPAEMVVLLGPGDDATAAAATLEAAGARVVTLDDSDPRDDPDAVAQLAAAGDVPVVALGSALGPADRLDDRIAVARAGRTFPDGRQTLFPHRRMVALYGHPLTSALGVLGEQGPLESVQRVTSLAESYEPYSEEPVLPAFEIIATVASGAAGPDGDYSNETPIDVLQPYVDAAAAAGVYVVLDLQPGRSDFLSQAQEYEQLLALPHVGLALDPEWRLRPDQVHLEQIGSVDAAEVNQVAEWLASLVRDRALPQKLLLLHQFSQRMITDRQTLDLSHDELTALVQMDGDGTPGEKDDTWQALRADAPEGLLFGWKNFYDEDEPTFTPEQTMAVEPTPWWVSYQ
jgi:hypothetical protein